MEGERYAGTVLALQLLRKSKIILKLKVYLKKNTKQEKGCKKIKNVYKW